MSFESAMSKFGKALDKGVSKLVFLSKKAVGFFQKYLLQKNKESSNIKREISNGSSASTILIFDSFLAFLSISISIHLRIGMDFLDYSPMYILKNMLVFGLVSSSVFTWLQTNQSFWRYTTIEDMPPILLSVVLSNILFFPLMMLMNQGDFLPYSVLVINVFVLSISLMIPRFLSRMLYNQKLSKIKQFNLQAKKASRSLAIPDVLLVGTPASIENFTREVVANDDIAFNLNPIGILTLDESDIGRTIKGIPILGEISDIKNVMSVLHKESVFPRQLVICDKNIPVNAKRFLTKYSEVHGILLIHVMFKCTLDKIAPSEEITQN